MSRGNHMILQILWKTSYLWMLLHKYVLKLSKLISFSFASKEMRGSNVNYAQIFLFMHLGVYS